mmetsp:Transcript_2980/g.3776  ORF Transcript_2980/g.3776 Transcript_2980/m.3776 type:complete len:106 (-) Transcript_2980:566-883(-)
MAGGNGNREAEKCFNLAQNISENFKLVVNEPVSGLYFVHKHVREKALYDMIRSKTRLLKHLSKLRHKLAHVNSDIIENRIEETVKHATLKTEEVIYDAIDSNRLL